MIRANVQNMLWIKSELLYQWKKIAQTAIRNRRIAGANRTITELLQDSLNPTFNQMISGRVSVARLGGMHAMGWQLVGATGERLNLQTIKMIQRYAAFADRVAFFDGLGDVSLGQSRGLD